MDGFSLPRAATTGDRAGERSGGYEPDTRVDVVDSERRGVPVLPNRQVGSGDHIYREDWHAREMAAQDVRPACPAYRWWVQSTSDRSTRNACHVHARYVPA